MQKERGVKRHWKMNKLANILYNRNFVLKELQVREDIWGFTRTNVRYVHSGVRIPCKTPKNVLVEHAKRNIALIKVEKKKKMPTKLD